MRIWQWMSVLMLAWVRVAPAVMIDPAGRGQVLLAPYYTVNGGQQTLLSVVNQSGEVKAIKIRFRESRNGREVYALNLYLAANDVWTAALLAVDDTGAARLLTHDNSCTVPAIKSSTSLPILLNFTRYAGFHADDYSGARADGGPGDLTRTREGYVEMIEMGTLRENSPYAAAATHVSGVPSNCAALETAWRPGGYWALDPQADLLAPSGLLSGTTSILDSRGGALYSVPMTALSRFSVVAQHSGPTAALPDLSSAVTEHSRTRVESTVLADGAIHRSYWPQERAFDAVSAALSASSVSNEYNQQSDIAARSDWVLTFPTRRFYERDVRRGDASPFAPGPADQLCVTRRGDGTYEAHDRETRRPLGLIDTPGVHTLNRVYCRAVHVFSFGFAESLLSAQMPERLPMDFGAAPVFPSGWLRLSFVDSARTRPALGGEYYQGVPAIGFWALRYGNAAQGSETRSYASAINHQRAVRCHKADGQPCDSL